MKSFPRSLIILPYVPWPIRRGTYQRIYHLTRELARQGELDLFCLSHEAEDVDEMPRFAAFCHRVRFSTFRHPAWPSLRQRLPDPLPTTVRHWESASVLADLRAFADGQSYGLVHACDLVLWPYVRALFPDHPCRVLDRSRVDWLFQTEELRTLPLSSKEKLLRRENLWKLARLERLAAREARAEVVCGPDDKTFLCSKLRHPPDILVLANGYDPGHFDIRACPRAPTPHPSALFCGALDYSPNVDCLDWYFHQMHDRILAAVPDYRFLLVGKSPTDQVREWARRPGVDFVGEVADVRPWYQQAWAHWVPLRIGGGTRLKIVESLAMRTPVLSTPLGAQGLDLLHGEHLLLAEGTEAFVDAAIRMLQDPALRDRLAETGGRQVEKLYPWSRLGEQLAGFYRELAGS